MEKEPKEDEALCVPSGSVGPNICLGGLIVGMNHAHKNVVEVLQKSGVDLLLESVAETGRVRCDVRIDEGEGAFPSGFVIQRLGSLEVLEAEADVVGCTGVTVVLLVMLGQALRS